MATKITKVGDAYVYEFTNESAEADVTPEVSPEETVTIDVVEGEATEEEVEQKVREALAAKPQPFVRKRDRTKDDDEPQRG